MKLTTVVIPTCNKRLLLSRTLESLFLQDIPASGLEIVVVDDGSDDDTREVLPEEPPVSVIYERHPKTRGRAQSRNTGVRRAAGETIIFLDDDMVVGPGFVGAHLAAHGPAKNKVVIGNVATAPEANGSSVSKYLDTRGVQKMKSSGVIPPRYFSTNNSSVRKDLLLSVGLFDERFVTYGFEDVDLGYRLGKAGAEFVFARDAVSSHIHRHSLRELLDKKVLCGRSSLRVLIEKHPELKEVLRLNLLEPVSFPGDGYGNILRKLVLSIFLRRLFYNFGFYLGERLPPGRAAFRVIDFLVFYSYAEGLKLNEG